jgi:hypothetical protein
MDQTKNSREVQDAIVMTHLTVALERLGDAESLLTPVENSNVLTLVRQAKALTTLAKTKLSES